MEADVSLDDLLRPRSRPAAVLVLGYGNPSRGDDALGPAFVERARAAAGHLEVPGGIEFLTDFQLQVEHALDLIGRRLAVFVDASADAPAPFACSEVAARRDDSHSSHALSPSAVLQVYADVVGGPPPRCRLLAIRGESFELGADLGTAATANLDAALEFFAREILRQDGGP